MLINDSNSKSLLDTIGSILSPVAVQETVAVVKEEDKKEETEAEVKECHVERLIDLLKTRANELRVTDCGDVELVLHELAEKIKICIESESKVCIVVTEGEGSAESIDTIEIKGALAKKVIESLVELLTRNQGQVVPQQGQPAALIKKIESLKK